MAKTKTEEEEGEVVKEDGLVGVKFSFLDQLPPELQRRVAYFVFAGDSIVFRRLVSKSLTSRLVLPAIHKTMSIELNPHPDVPYLLSLQDENNVLRFYHPLLSGSHGTQIPELSSQAFIRYSNYGWLLMSTINDEFFFFEPFSQVKIQLPKYDRGYSPFCYMCFSSPPTSSDCFVIGIDVVGTSCYIIRRGEKNWSERPFFIRGQPQHFYIWLGTVPLMHNGLCYCLGHLGFLGVFNPNDEKPKWNVYGHSYPKELKNSIGESFLLGRKEGELLRVLLVGEDKKILYSVFSIKKKELGQERTDLNLENKMLFLSYESSFLGSIDLRGMHNKIYFPMIHRHASLFYSQNQKRYLSFHTNYSNRNYFGDGKVFSNAAWVKRVPSRALGSTEW